MEVKEYFLGNKASQWRTRDVKSITFIVTEDCNLKCKYCYMTGKNKRNKMTFEVAKKAVDYILNHPEEFPEGSVIWDFIGGEPFLEIDLIDKITDYIKKEMYRLKHKWFDNYRINFSSNGILYDHPRVQKYIQKNRKHLSIGISIDGNKIKHDLQRIKYDGSGSYDDVVKNVPLWLEQFPNAMTKATFASEDLPYLKDSIINLWNLGIKEVAANVIFEDVWKEGDDIIFEKQLKELADFIIDNHLWDKFNCTFFSDSIGFPLPEVKLKENWCGAGKMLAVDYQGKFYPCVRFVDYSLSYKNGYVIGDIENGIDYDKVRAFLALTLKSQSPDECINCSVASGCAWCQGFNYDVSKHDSIYERATFICKMHKARVRANDYYWARLKEVAGIQRKTRLARKNNLFFILSDKVTRHCTYNPEKVESQKMSLETFKQGLDFARRNFYTPILLLPEEGLTLEQKDLLKGFEPILISTKSQTGLKTIENLIVYEGDVLKLQDGEIGILIIPKNKLSNLSNLVKKILTKQSRLHLVVEDYGELTDKELELYELELTKIADYLVSEYINGNYLEVNVLSDRLFLTQMVNCNAGVTTFALAPDGNFYLCPAFYFDKNGEAVGDLEKGINFDYQKFLTAEKSPLCSECDVYHCRRCIYLNKLRTNEYLIPGKAQCLSSHIERKVSKYYAEKLHNLGILKHLTDRSVKKIFGDLDFSDPLVLITGRVKRFK